MTFYFNYLYIVYMPARRPGTKRKVGRPAKPKRCPAGKRKTCKCAKPRRPAGRTGTKRKSVFVMRTRRLFS